MIFFHGTVKLNACLYDSGVVVGMGWYDGGGGGGSFVFLPLIKIKTRSGGGGNSPPLTEEIIINARETCHEATNHATIYPRG